MSDKFFKIKSKDKNQNNRAFTLIELLVVVAIIGILSSVVLASLNSAREKSNVALIKSTLKQLYAQAQINFTENGSFINSNPSNTDLTCTGPGNNLGKIVQPLIDKGIIVKCFSFYGTGSGGIYAGDDYLRFGATALIYDTSELKAWSVDENGVVKWDLKGVTSTGAFVSTTDTVMNWQPAFDACVKSNGRLPSLEQIRSLSYAARQGSGDTSFYPIGFTTTDYWSSNRVPSAPLTNSYWQNVSNGGIAGVSQTTLVSGVRCVR